MGSAKHESLNSRKTSMTQETSLFELVANLMKKYQAAYCSSPRAIIYNTAKSQICVAVVEL